ncbi:MAG: CPBP family intramembrane metalloprotease [Spirochaetes bacterium]|nr:CPBP family intramembrane metalloprotease [Spirochaetota bacterium]
MKNILPKICFICSVFFALVVPKYNFIFSCLASIEFYILNTIFLLAILLLLYYKSRQLYVPALLFVFIYLYQPLIPYQVKLIGIQFPGVDYLIPCLAYVVMVLSIRSMRSSLGWLRWGKVKRIDWWFIAVSVVISSAALFLWAIYIKKDLSVFHDKLPSMPIVLLCLGGVVFAVLNTLVEELFTRLVMWDGLSAVFSNIAVIVIIQALFFSLWHVQGFPRGLIGIGMAFVWAVFLGIIRYRTKGVLAPLITHFLADAVIFIIIILTLN